MLVGHLPLEAYPPAGVKTGVDEFRGEAVWQVVDAPPRGCAPSIGLSRCRGCLGLLLVLPLRHQLRFGAVEDVSHLLPMVPRHQEVRVDDLAVWDLRAGGVDDRQPHVAAHDRKPPLARWQENAKTLIKAAVVLLHPDEVVLHRPDELVAEVL